jgi:hypothetical protein
MGPRVLLVTDDVPQRETITTMVMDAVGSLVVQSTRDLTLAPEFAGHISLAIVAAADDDAERICAEIRNGLGSIPILAVTGARLSVEGVRALTARELHDAFNECVARASAASGGVREQAGARRFLQRILVKRRGKAVAVSVEDIQWIEAAGNYVRLHTADDQFLLRAVIGRLQNDLDPNHFQRINRSVMVNVDWMRDIRPDYKGDYIVSMSRGLELKLTRAYRDAVFGQFRPDNNRMRRIS